MSAPPAAEARPLRLMLHDATCRGGPARPGLSHAWTVGGALYRGLHHLDAWRGVASWAEGLEWLLDVAPSRRVAEIQFWGHGRFGAALIAGERLDVRALEAGHPHHARLAALRARLVGPEALWWFRTCDTFGTAAGHEFARAWTRFHGCRAAGHTHVIGFWQSGLHVLGPAEEPTWSVEEGVDPSRPSSSGRASRPWLPDTISCLRAALPVVRR